ncbi:protein kinase-like domain-containing protein [Artemisia annua]|uniref:Protein kinase-like domain-containing protein n=1 Tax=Artemisia annua TaxID=35608 RepID=A0A2U1QCA8_ARTAN|nr:protein kinase-like domain-containing protein [Artemisia annua]
MAGLFGLDGSTTKNFWIGGAIILVIILTIILWKWAVYVDSRAKARSLARVQNNKDRELSSLSTTKSIRTYALEELKGATRDFRIRIGVGATSYVYLAELGDGQFGAVKRVMEERGGCQKIFLDEVSILLRISHPNLVGLLGFCLDKALQDYLQNHVERYFAILES